MITLSIVIVNYNVCGFLEQCLLSLADAVKEIRTRFLSSTMLRPMVPIPIYPGVSRR